MSGFEIAGIVLAIPSTLHLINRTILAIKDAKNVPQGVLELLEVIRKDVEGLSELSKEHGDFFSNPSRRDSVQGLHDDLQEVLRGCEGKYLGKRGLLKKVKEMLSDGDVDQHLTRIHQRIQKAYSKWMFEIEFRTNTQVEALKARFQALENKMDAKFSSVQSGIRRLSEDRGKKGKSSRKAKKPRYQGVRSKKVGLSGAEVTRKRRDVAV